MKKNDVEIYISQFGKYFPQDKLVDLQKDLLSLDDKKKMLIEQLAFKNPTTILIGSLFLGLDRFMLGQTGLALLKIVTGGGCFVWWMLDVFSAMSRARNYNYALFKRATGK